MWADQPPYVAAFYTLVPHRIESEDDTRISGHTGGDISGYLIAKIGINVDAASGSSRLPGDPGHTLSNILLLLIDAVVHASRASYLAGGRYVFIDINNEPSTLSDAVQQIGFSSISSAGSSMHVMKVPRPRNIPS